MFIFVANWSSLIPGVEPPTAHLETDAALALLVFLAVIWFGVRAGGLRGYLATFASPSPIMIPLNFVESLTRTFSLLVRLFGNVMSGVFVIGIVLSLAGLLVPIPLMALDLLTGAVQAYIFAILAMVFIAGAVGDVRRPGRLQPKDPAMNWIAIVSIFSAALRSPSARSARRSPKGAPWPPRWTPSPASPRRPTPFHARCSSAWR